MEESQLQYRNLAPSPTTGGLLLSSPSSLLPMAPIGQTHQTSWRRNQGWRALGSAPSSLQWRVGQGKGKDCLWEQTGQGAAHHTVSCQNHTAWRSSSSPKEVGAVTRRGKDAGQHLPAVQIGSGLLCEVVRCPSQEVWTETGCSSARDPPVLQILLSGAFAEYKGKWTGLSLYPFLPFLFLDISSISIGHSFLWQTQTNKLVNCQQIWFGRHWGIWHCRVGHCVSSLHLVFLVTSLLLCQKYCCQKWSET